MNKNINHEYVRIHDPGHSWLAVPVQDVRDIGVLPQITAYSPTVGGMMYLEEDCDMWAFYKAMLDNGVSMTVVNENVDDFEEYLKTV